MDGCVVVDRSRGVWHTYAGSDDFGCVDAGGNMSWHVFGGCAVCVDVTLSLVMSSLLIVLSVVGVSCFGTLPVAYALAFTGYAVRCR